MKTRAEIYGKEAADLLRNITTYHCIRHDQCLRLYPDKEEKISTLLSFFGKQGRIFWDKKWNMYHDGTEDTPDYEMLAAICVLADFINRVDCHSSAQFPVKVIFIAGGELYEVTYVEPGNETLMEHALSKLPEDAEKRIVIVESAEQITVYPPGGYGVLYGGYGHRRCSILQTGIRRTYWINQTF